MLKGQAPSCPDCPKPIHGMRAVYAVTPSTAVALLEDIAHGAIKCSWVVFPAAISSHPHSALAVSQRFLTGD